MAFFWSYQILKSSLLSLTTRAKPKIGDYPFTTTNPNLGVLNIDDKEIVIADIPGLIKGAHKGVGLGDKFLKHIERCKSLLHLIDINEDNLFNRYKIAPQRICFEVTETSTITHLKSALHFMDNMIAFGCSFSLDDFGTGLSSFSYLQKLPVSTIKIDGSFVRDMDTNEVNYIFVENIKRIATAMNKKTVAEFVESEEIEALLTEIGIDYGQGYHIHKPEPWISKGR